MKTWERVIAELEANGALEKSFEGLDSPDYTMDVIPAEETPLLFAREPNAIIAHEKNINVDMSNSFIKELESILEHLNELVHNRTIDKKYLFDYAVINDMTWTRIKSEQNLPSKHTVCSIAMSIFDLQNRYDSNISRLPMKKKNDCFEEQLNKFLLYQGNIMSPFLVWDVLITNFIKDDIFDMDEINEEIDDANNLLLNKYNKKYKLLPRLGAQEVGKNDGRRRNKVWRRQ